MDPMVAWETEDGEEWVLSLLFYVSTVTRGQFAQKKDVTLLPRATDFREKKFSASSIRIVSYCKYDMYFKKYDMYSIVGIDKKTYGEGIGITYIYM